MPDTPTTIPGWGPGLHHQLKYTGTGQLTFAQLEDFLHKATASEIPAGAFVEFYVDSGDRPGDRGSWSVTVSWKEDR